MTRHRAIPLNRAVKRTTVKKLLLQTVLETVESDAAERMYQIQLVAFMQRYRVSSIRKKASRERRWRQRKRWEDFSTSLTDRQFRRYFRMPRECFDLLCKKIRANVGEDKFKSEEYLEDLTNSLAPPDSIATCRLRRLAKANLNDTGGWISGEVKLAITLRMLAGGSYLDLGLIFGTGSTYPYTIFNNVITRWICKDDLVKISGLEYCNDDGSMKC